MPSSVVTIDEAMIPSQVRLLFEQYISHQAHKYGVKMYKLATTDEYTCNFVIYIDQQHPMASFAYGQTVETNLLDGLDECYLTVIANNFFISIHPAERLLEHDIYLIRTLRSNHIGSRSEVVHEKISTRRSLRAAKQRWHETN